jgi:short-subunit dehydrogenase
VDLAATDLAGRFDAAVAGLDIGLVIYNACYSRVADFTNVPLEEHQRMLDVNCRGPVVISQRMVPRLIARGRGGLILMSSMAGFQGAALVSTYAGTKAFNIVLAESLWHELSPQGIDVLACVAGATTTPGFEAITPQARRAKAFPMRPEAVAREGLAALGKRPVHIAGRLNRFVNVLARFMSRRGRSRFFSNATRSIYG